MIAQALRRAAVLHADETTTSIAGARWWLHVACTDTLTAFHLDPSRGRTAITAFGILPGHTGTWSTTPCPSTTPTPAPLTRSAGRTCYAS